MRILICSHWMEIGGAERALLGLLYSLNYEDNNVDLYLCRHSGEFMQLIPKQVNLLPEDPNAASIAMPIKEVLKRGKIGIIVGRLIGKICTKRYLMQHQCGINNIAIEYSNRFTYPFVKKINPKCQYDLMISFLEPHYIAAHKTQANKKIAWMHTDYGFIDIDANAGYKIWNCYDGIAAISEKCAKNFIMKYPQLSNKVFLMENILHPDLIYLQASEFDARKEMKGEIVLLSIGRFARAKNFDNIPEICAKIREAGLDVTWYIIGYGSEETIIYQKICEFDMEKHVVILGKKENPYPYIAACDLYVQPSRYEGKSVTVREAQILGKPVVITRYDTSCSQLEEDVDGVIVPLDNKGCAEGIVNLLKNEEKMKKIAETCKSKNYSNGDQIDKIFCV